ncbi:hypothetical protein BDZ89DRAFT_1065743, partial [Hymenopellis radicata]
MSDALFEAFKAANPDRRTIRHKRTDTPTLASIRRREKVAAMARDNPTALAEERRKQSQRVALHRASLRKEKIRPDVSSEVPSSSIDKGQAADKSVKSTASVGVMSVRLARIAEASRLARASQHHKPQTRSCQTRLLPIRSRKGKKSV